MYPGFLRDGLVLRIFQDCFEAVRAPAVPDASHIVSGDDLDEAAGFNMSDLDEFVVEEEDVGRVPGGPLRCALPLDCTCGTAWVSMFVNV